MANQEPKLNISELDFEGIKTNLKAFLKDQSEFSDYNFEGSGLSILLDVLAYNTHYMGYYMNMVANEMFIDTAIMRPSVVSHAKLLGYTPGSRVASQAQINVAFQEVSGGSNSALSIPRFTRFISTPKDGVSYTFVSAEDRVATKNATGTFVFSNLTIKEGQPLGYTFTYDSATNPKQIFELPDAGIDISTLQVQVQNSVQNANLETFVVAQNSTEVVSDSAVYYIEENRNGKYQIYFGDNILGKKLVDGNIVIVSYIVTSGDAANGIKQFKLSDNILNSVTPTISLVIPSNSGRLEESIDEIKFTATKSFIAQNRAVTKNDYVAMISKRYPYFDAVTVWGGEESVPPVYGKIFFSAKPRGNYEITESEIEYVKNNIIKPMSVITVTPEYVSPDYNYMNFIVDVIYDPRKTSKTAGGIQAAVYDAIVGFADSNLNSFNSAFKISKLIRAIDDADPSIENNSLKVMIEKRLQPTEGASRSYKVDFHVPLSKGTALDRIFSETAFDQYDGDVLRTAYFEEVPQSFTGIDAIDIVESGSGYTDLPEVVIDGDGTGATAGAIIVNGKLKSVVVTSSGNNYSSAQVRIVGGGGSGAVVKAVMQGKRGKLRTFYYDTNNAKKVLNADAGDIFYDDGYIQLNNFNPVSVKDPYSTMVFKAIPATNVFSTKRNAILTLDTTDPASIAVRVGAVTQ